jgi:hypothetical protein
MRLSANPGASTGCRLPHLLTAFRPPEGRSPVVHLATTLDRKRPVGRIHNLGILVRLEDEGKLLGGRGINDLGPTKLAQAPGCFQPDELERIIKPGDKQLDRPSAL